MLCDEKCSLQFQDIVFKNLIYNNAMKNDYNLLLNVYCRAYNEHGMCPLWSKKNERLSFDDII